MYAAYLPYRHLCLHEFFYTRISPCFDHRGIIPLGFDQLVVFAKSQNHINFCYYLAIVVRQFVIQVSPFNLHRNNLVEMSTVRTYYILSFCTNCHICLIFFNVVFQKLYPEKITELSQVTKKVHLVRS